MTLLLLVQTMSYSLVKIVWGYVAIKCDVEPTKNSPNEAFDLQWPITIPKALFSLGPISGLKPEPVNEGHKSTCLVRHGCQDDTLEWSWNQ